MAATAAPQQQSERRPARRQRGEAKDGGDRNLRDLVGAGPSQLGPSKALRVRDADRPSVDELAAAERNVVIVRRNWTPEEN